MEKNKFLEEEESKKVESMEEIMQKFSLEFNQGNWDKAKRILVEAFEKRKQILGVDNPETLNIQIEIARMSLAREENQNALDMFEEIHEKQVKVLGSVHHDTVKTKRLICFTLRRLGKNEKALELYREVYNQLKEVLGSNHDDTLSSKLDIAMMLNNLGRFSEALKINKEIFKQFNEKRGPNAELTLHVQNDIAFILLNEGHYDEALNVFKEVYEKEKMVFGYNNVHTLNALYNMVATFILQKNFFSAFKVLKEAYVSMKSVYGENHPEMLQMLCKLELIKLELRSEGKTEQEIMDHFQKEINVAASIGNVEKVRRLLKEGVSVNDTDIEGRAPLQFAAVNGHIDVVRILLENKANILQATNKGNTPLHLSVSKGYLKIVELLIKHVHQDEMSDFLNAKTVKSGLTSLHIAAKNGFSDIAKCLLKNGAAYNARNNEKKTALDLCLDGDLKVLLEHIEEIFTDCESGNNDCIKKLKSLGQEAIEIITSARNKYDKTLLQVAKTNRHRRIVARLLEIIKLNKSSETPNNQQRDINIAVVNGDAEAVKNLISAGADVNGKYKGGWTLLHHAVEKGHLNIVKILLENGADASRVTCKGNTVLHTAALQRQVRITKVLLEHMDAHYGPREMLDIMNAKTVLSGSTALHVASRNGYGSLVSCLLSHGATHKIRDKNGFTPIEVSKDSHIKKIYEFFELFFVLAIGDRRDDIIARVNVIRHCKDTLAFHPELKFVLRDIFSVQTMPEIDDA